MFDTGLEVSLISRTAASRARLALTAPVWMDEVRTPFGYEMVMALTTVRLCLGLRPIPLECVMVRDAVLPHGCDLLIATKDLVTPTQNPWA